MTRKMKIAVVAPAAIAALALAAVLGFALAGGAAKPPAAHNTTPAAAPRIPPAPAGCSRASALAGTIRSDLTADPSGTKAALHQLQALAKTLPDGQLRSDVDLAALHLALFREYELMGGPAARSAKDFAADLNKIQAECA